MSTVLDILHQKEEEVYSISKDAAVLEAARKMNDCKIGVLVVVEGVWPLAFLPRGKCYAAS